MNRLHRFNSSSSSSYHRWQESCRKASSSATNAWSLESLLIKPVQRLLKYPLLLKLLSELTSDSHPDKYSLDKAVDSISTCATRINEESRRALPSTSEPDLRGKSSGARKAMADKLKLSVGRSGSDKSTSSPFSHQSTNSTATSITSSYTAASSTSTSTITSAAPSSASTPVQPAETVDKTYDIIVDQFRRRHFELRVVIECFAGAVNLAAASLNSMYALGSSLEEFARLPQNHALSLSQSPRIGSNTAPTSMKSTPTHPIYPHATDFSSFKRAAQDIRESELPRFRTTVMTHVIAPLEQVLDLFDGPINKAMARRDRKVADYKRFLSLSDRGIPIDTNTVSSAESFSALNGRLVIEIPRFLEAVDDMVKAVTLNWIDVQARWNLVCARRVRIHCANDLQTEGNGRTEKGIPGLTAAEIELAFVLRYSKAEEKISQLRCCRPQSPIVERDAPRQKRITKR